MSGKMCENPLVFGQILLSCYHVLYFINLKSIITRIILAGKLKCIKLINFQIPLFSGQILLSWYRTYFVNLGFVKAKLIFITNFYRLTQVKPNVQNYLITREIHTHLIFLACVLQFDRTYIIPVQFKVYRSKNKYMLY